MNGWYQSNKWEQVRFCIDPGHKHILAMKPPDVSWYTIYGILYMVYDIWYTAYVVYCIWYLSKTTNVLYHDGKKN